MCIQLILRTNPNPVCVIQRAAFSATSTYLDLRVPIIIEYIGVEKQTNQKSQYIVILKVSLT